MKYKVVGTARYEKVVEAEDEENAIWEALRELEDDNPDFTVNSFNLFNWEAVILEGGEK